VLKNRVYTLSGRVNKCHQLAAQSSVIIKDSLGLFMFLIACVGLMEVFALDFVVHHENCPEGSFLVPPRTNDELAWYFLHLFAISRWVSDEAVGLVLMFLSIVLVSVLPLLSRVADYLFTKLRFSSTFVFTGEHVYHRLCWLFFSVVILLGWVGSQPADDFFIFMSFYLTVLYFILLLILPFVTYLYALCF